MTHRAIIRCLTRMACAMAVTGLTLAPAVTHAADTIVGTWAPDPLECTPMNAVHIGPLDMMIGDEFACSFRDVSRAGEVVTWHGNCGGPEQPKDRSTVVAERRGKLLYIRLNGAQNGPYQRCGAQSAASAPAVAQAEGADAEQSIATLRAVYAGPNPYGVFKSRDRNVLGRVLTPALVETWAGPEGDGPQSDGSPIAWSKMTDSVRLTAVTPRAFSGDRGTLDATVEVVVEGRHVTKQIMWDMQKVGGRWLADDSHYAGHGFRAVFAAFAPAATPTSHASLRASADKLPLRHGIFVLNGVPCDERSNATVQSFWGDRLNAGHEIGKVVSAVHRGDTYHVTFAYEDLDGENRYMSQELIKIRSPLAYSTSGADGRRTEMRWCADKM